MPNGAQASTEEGEASGGESQEEEEWDSDVAEDDDDDDDDGNYLHPSLFASKKSSRLEELMKVLHCKVTFYF